MPNPLTRALAATACAIALTACTETGTPIPTDGPAATNQPGAPTTTTSADNTFGAPRVENPLDPEPLLADPCMSLSTAQRKALGLRDKARPGSDFDTLGPYCSWYDTTGRMTFLVGFLTPNENGLSDIYRGQEQGHWGYFEPTTVDGYPAVFEDGADRRARGICNIVVGITDTLAFNTRVEFAPVDEVCNMAKEAASEVIKTLKAGE